MQRSTGREKEAVLPGELCRDRENKLNTGKDRMSKRSQDIRKDCYSMWPRRTIQRPRENPD